MLIAILIVPSFINLLIGYILFKIHCKQLGRKEVTLEDFVVELSYGFGPLPPLPILIIPPANVLVTILLVVISVICIPIKLWFMIYDRIKYLKI